MEAEVRNPMNSGRKKTYRPIGRPRSKKVRPDGKRASRAGRTAHARRTPRTRGSRRAASGLTAAGLYFAAGSKDGARWRAAHPDRDADSFRHAVQAGWARLAEDRPDLGGSWTAGRQAAGAYRDGFAAGADFRAPVVPLALKGKASAVLFADPDPRKLQAVLEPLEALPLQEIVVVTADFPEAALEAARRCDRALIVHLPDTMDPDVGRALGAKLTGADVVLFADGSRPMPAEDLARFLWECDNGTDVVLCDRTRSMDLFHRRNHALRLREFLNFTIGRPDLTVHSLEDLPHALSRRAIDAIGPRTLSVPAKAHVKAVLGGLRIGLGAAAAGLPERPGDRTEAEWLRRLAGDYAEAWMEAMEALGERLNFPDRFRNRRALGGPGG